MTTIRKPLRRRVQCDGQVPHGVNPELVITLYPGGMLGLRETGRRQSSEIQVHVGVIYARALAGQAREKRGRVP